VDEFGKYFGPGNREERAARLDGEATADPTKASSAEHDLASKLQDIMRCEYDVSRHVRWLLEQCGGDVDGLASLLVAKANDFGFLSWVWDNEANIYQVRAMLKADYDVQQGRQQRQEKISTAEYRHEKYAGGKYAAFIQS